MAFEFQPSLKGNLVELRPLRRTDFEALYAVARDPLIWEQHPVTSRHNKRQFRTFFAEALACGGTLLVLEAGTAKVIGSSRFHGYDAARREVEIGWTFLSRSHWGGRYNGEMKRLMMQHAFRFVDSVVFLVALTNYRSQRSVERIGGIRTGIGSDAGGRESYVYRISAMDFKSRDVSGWTPTA
jgi:RimJ/RimL family protein N-acetyltransferase